MPARPAPAARPARLLSHQATNTALTLFVERRVPVEAALAIAGCQRADDLIQTRRYRAVPAEGVQVWRTAGDAAAGSVETPATARIH